ncbi:MAG: SDR family oxidoreductase [Nocardiopsaceae bacterium]|jgi:NAD(P)-dependent dehydrogenase (short-subunit alcohol dehydrogenase family)|nr:SDR family oxidoreductase [Nocardiopsaceae bacterium]
MTSLEGTLAGKAALVTGGGTGIGAAIAGAFAGAGAGVVVTGRRPGPLAQTVERITGAGGAALAVPADVTDLAAMTGAVRQALDRSGRLDIVVANAGIVPESRPVLEYPPGEWQRALDINLSGVWNTAKASVPALISAGGGSVLIIGSGLARVSAGGAGAYAVAKAGASALTRVLAAELREPGIAVNEVVPGPTRTRALGGEHPSENEVRWAEAGEWLKDPADVARLALFVAGLPPHGPTGQVFSLAGRLL